MRSYSDRSAGRVLSTIAPTLAVSRAALFDAASDTGHVRVHGMRRPVHSLALTLMAWLPMCAPAPPSPLSLVVVVSRIWYTPSCARVLGRWAMSGCAAHDRPTPYPMLY